MISLWHFITTGTRITDPEPTKGYAMTYSMWGVAMWGIVIGLILIFGVSLVRYGHSLRQGREARGVAGERQRPDDSP
ncbi:hypothetical protein LMG24076_04913 [Trinickia soli]|uniref:Uncharacterized protein n=1 Tax=Trinickia soli TaxID=380675 RepID=A0A2N7VK78_9BURK|nr:hypothetical protein CIW54_01945 [Paraburkholderia sp. T12-10]PMS17523.1 hypothetical protein C0Z19_24155 [Trinickia soli]CAB3724130.1 hypothetical protein LMG24076_04913 [Trinickia soli]